MLSNSETNEQSKAYEIWCKFAFEKVTDGALRLEKSGEAKKDLSLK
jgi:hypothetical protein